MNVLVANAGSTSLKLRVVDEHDEVIEGRDLGPDDDSRAALEEVLGRGSVDAVAHRVVHGGPRFSEATRLDPSVRDALEELNDLAPLHNPPALTIIDQVSDLAPGLPQAASFDTAFHADLPAPAASYALPPEWTGRYALRRYGFHGLSCRWAVGRAEQLLGRPAAGLRLLICHLGGGASVTAVVDGRSVDTTMGFTPADGLIMATRSGDVDPGLMAWLVQHGVSGDELAAAVEQRSGLLALSDARSGDLRDLLTGRRDGDPAATLAVEAYLHRLVAKIGAMAASAGGVNAIVFTGGVGEHSPEIRGEVARRLAWLGVAIDPAMEPTGDADLSLPGAPVHALLIRSREELVIADECRPVLVDDWVSTTKDRALPGGHERKPTAQTRRRPRQRGRTTGGDGRAGQPGR